MPRSIRAGRRPPSGPLSREEMHRLNAWLGEHGEDIKGFDELDGFITAVTLLPGQLSPAIWYPNILGGIGEAETEQRVEAAEQAGALDLLVRHWRHVVRRLSREEEWEAAACDDEMLSPDFYWALGFQEGIDRSEEFWQHLAPMREWEVRLPSIRLLLQVEAPGGGHFERSLEERETLLRQAEREVTALYRAVRRAG